MVGSTLGSLFGFTSGSLVGFTSGSKVGLTTGSLVFDFLTRQAASGKPKLVGSRGSMVAKLKLKGIDGRAPPGVEPVA